jgi:DNA polymerase III subunit chi
MTRIEFHFNVDDPLLHACRLARKISRLGQGCVFTGPESWLRQLDTRLWTFSALDFLPHHWAGQAAGTATITLAPEPGEAWQDAAVLVNTGQEVPEGFARWTRLIEIVGREPGDRGAARERWRHYSRLGYALGQHDLAGEGHEALANRG